VELKAGKKKPKGGGGRLCDQRILMVDPGEKTGKKVKKNLSPLPELSCAIPETGKKPKASEAFLKKHSSDYLPGRAAWNAS